MVDTLSLLATTQIQLTVGTQALVSLNKQDDVESKTGAGAGAGAGDGARAVTSIMTGRSDVKMEFYNTLSTYLFEEIRTNFRLWILKKARLQLRITDWKKSIQN